MTMLPVSSSPSICATLTSCQQTQPDAARNDTRNDEANKMKTCDIHLERSSALRDGAQSGVFKHAVHALEPHKKKTANASRCTQQYTTIHNNTTNRACTLAHLQNSGTQFFVGQYVVRHKQSFDGLIPCVATGDDDDAVYLSMCASR